MNDDHASAYQTRDKISHNRGDSSSRIPLPKARRATGDSVHRPHKSGAQTKIPVPPVPIISTTTTGPPSSRATSAPSTPRAVPRNKSKHAAQLGSSSSAAYTFDEYINDPFARSTPPTFKASMEPTGSSKPASSRKEVEEGGDTPSRRSFGFDPTIDPFARSTPSTFTPSMKPTGPKQGSANGGISAGISASRRAAAAAAEKAKDPVTTSRPLEKESEMSTPQPPAVASARNVVTPSTPEPVVEKTTFIAARSRAASVSSGGQATPRYEDMILPAVARRIKEQGIFDHDVVAYSDDYDAPLYKAPTTVQGPFASYDRAKSASSASLIIQQQRLSAAIDAEDLPPNPPVPDVYQEPESPIVSKKRQDNTDQVVPEINKREKRSPDQQTGFSEDQALDQQQQQQQQQQPQPPGSPVSSRPERPRRARRNTDHPTQPASPVLAHEERPRRARRPAPDEPFSTDNQPSSPRQQRRDRYESNQSWETGYQQQQQQQQYQRQSQDQYSYQSDSRDRYQQNENRSQDLSHIHNRYERNEYNTSPVLQHQQQYQQQQQQQQQHQYQPRTDSREPYYNASPVPSSRNQYSGQIEVPQHNGYQNQEYHQDGYDSQRTRYSPQHGNPYSDYNNGQNGYDAQQTGYDTQQNGGYGGKQGGYDGQPQQQGYTSQPTPPLRSPRRPDRPDMVQVEMSDMSAGPKGSDANAMAGNPPKVEKKKKGVLCCNIM
ncbi:hypothetical protein BGX31_008746 [Mortierella sp. GBA43]|nr:hypothetical protein BGX31_008746 [Mortierella sp. GBA43]